MKIGSALAIAFALVAAPSVAADPPATDAPAPQVQKVLQNCDAHKFETVVEATVDGKPHKSRVKLCGNEGQSDAEWIGTLKDAIAKLRANKEIDPAVRDQIIVAINAEISRLGSPAPQAAGIGEAHGLAALNLGSSAPPPPVVAPPPLASEYSSLPPLPTEPPPPPHLLTPMVAGSSAAARGDRRAPAASLGLVPGGPAPKLSFACYSPGDIGGEAPCTGFDRDTMLTVSAQSDVPAGVSLWFLRNGDHRADVDLAQLRRGKSLRIALPSAVCQGVSDGSLELKLVQGGSELRSDGPYALRC